MITTVNGNNISWGSNFISKMSCKILEGFGPPNIVHFWCHKACCMHVETEGVEVITTIPVEPHEAVAEVSKI